MRLILIRHTKSDWTSPDNDHDRPLNARGRSAAAALGRWMAIAGLVPDCVLCSDALRTVQTWEGIAAALPGAPDPDLRPDMYLASPGTLLSVLNRHGTGQTVALLAHNPGIGQFAAQMAAAPPPDPDFQRYPTGATTVLDLPGLDCAGAVPGQGVLHAFVTPRGLLT